jgi:hypothetical protein
LSAAACVSNCCALLRHHLLTHLGKPFRHRLFSFQEGAMDLVTGQQSKVHGKSINSSTAFGNQTSAISVAPSKFRVNHVAPLG